MMSSIPAEEDTTNLHELAVPITTINDSNLVLFVAEFSSQTPLPSNANDPQHSTQNIEHQKQNEQFHLNCKERTKTEASKRLT